MAEIILRVVTFVVGVPIVYLLTRALKLLPEPLTIAEKRKEAVLSFLVMWVGW
jgi:hypothetical protein